MFCSWTSIGMVVVATFLTQASPSATDLLIQSLRVALVSPLFSASTVRGLHMAVPQPRAESGLAPHLRLLSPVKTLERNVDDCGTQYKRSVNLRST